MGAGKVEGDGVRRLRRYTPEERRAAVEAWRKSGLSQALFARQWGMSHVTLQGWAAKYAREGPKGLERLAEGPPRQRGKPPLAEPVKVEIAGVKRRFPTFGLRRIKDFLWRFGGLKVSTGSVKKVLKAEGLPPASPPPRRKRKKAVGPPQRFERAEVNGLWQSDITYVDVSWSRKPLYLVAFVDDHSRYVVSHGLHAHQRGEVVLECLVEGISRYGKPREVLTDQGRQYYAWRGKTGFQRRLKQEGIEHVVSRAHHPETLGKVERLWKTIQEELWARVMPRDLEDARARLKQWLDHYNFQRPHQGISGVTPADRYFGAERTVREAVERSVAENALRLALGEAPRRPVFLVGQIDGRTVSVHGEAGKVVVQLPDGERREIETKDLGVNPTKEASDERHEDDGERDDDGEGTGGGVGGGPRRPKPSSPRDQAHGVPGSAEDAGSDPGAVAGGERGAAGAGAPDGDGDPSHVAGEGSA